MNKKISLVEANTASKIDQLSTNLKEMVEANQKMIYDNEFKLEAVNKQLQDLTDTNRNQYNDLKDSFHQ